MLELDKNTPVAIALGFFDSVHLGHQKVLNAARDYAKSHGISTAVATFTNNAYKQFNTNSKLVFTYAERLTVLKDFADYIVPMRFDSKFKELHAKQFLLNGISRYNIKAIVCGYDYTFGAGAKGDIGLLKQFGAENGIDVIVIDKTDVDGERVSSTFIKNLLNNGDIEKANKMLGFKFFIDAKVVSGRGAGRMFDIPTANLKFSNDKIVVKGGVYATSCIIDGVRYRSATNVGGRPTFGLSKQVVETMIRDFNDNIYDKTIRVEFLARLRDEVKFETPALLSKQVHKDINHNY